MERALDFTPHFSPPRSSLLASDHRRRRRRVRVNDTRCPKSAAQLRALVASGFLDQRLALWRVNRWICQFGADKSPAARKRDGGEDPFAAVRRSFGNDAHPDCGAGPCEGDLAPWRRGDLALIGSTALLFVRGPNKQMGTNRNDCAVAGVVDGLAVLDRLDESYGNMIDHKRGLAQKEIFKTGLEGVFRDFPKTDILEGVSWVPEGR
ncbi:hypothetical protein JL721_903 [Aureococcus anophagefferens]|nr:hypothetical protein JL721_903 [Aureococcus anophagefferens]